jgi:hypothetical protein
MLSKLAEIAVKLFGIGKLLVPILAVVEFFRWIFKGVFIRLWQWLIDKGMSLWGMVEDYASSLEVDLAIPPEFAVIAAKVNTVFPLDEFVRYFLLYLGLASVVLVVKWGRNLIPSFS